MDFLSIGASLLGGLLGGGSSGSSTTQSTTNKEPWAPAQPFLLKDLQTNQALQSYYTKNPFNQQQMTGLQNTMNDADTYRNNIMPGLMNFANQGMTSNYQRQRGGAPGSGGGYGGPVQQGGLLQSGQGAFQNAPTGAMFGQVDWKGINPLTNGHMAAADTAREAAAKAAAEAEAKLLEELRQQQMMNQQRQYGGGDGYGFGGFQGDSNSLTGGLLGALIGQSPYGIDVTDLSTYSPAALDAMGFGASFGGGGYDGPGTGNGNGGGSNDRGTGNDRD